MSDLFDNFVSKLKLKKQLLEMAFISDDCVKILGENGIKEIKIFDHIDELTVEIGDFFHEHFVLYESTEKSIEQTTDQVLLFVQNVMVGKIAFKLTYLGNEIVEQIMFGREDNREISRTSFFWKKITNYLKKKRTVEILW